MGTTETKIKRLQREVEKLKRQVAQLQRSGTGMRRAKVNKSKRTTSRTKRTVKLGGLWAGTPEITERDIEEARTLAWGHFGKGKP